MPIYILQDSLCSLTSAELQQLGESDGGLQNLKWITPEQVSMQCHSPPLHYPVVSVKCPEHKMSCLGNGEGRFDGLEVSHLPDENDIRVLAKDGF